jgi:hypothetical protein
MKTLVVIALIISASVLTYGQEIQKDLNEFNSIIASPKINLVLKQGSKESIRLVYDRVDREKINIHVSGKKLRIFLDDAQTFEKQEWVNEHGKQSIYRDVNITAYVTYVNLNELEIRGDQELTCLDLIRSESFTLKAYGENDITLANLRTADLRVSLYGENKLTIEDGKADYQKYRLFGENKIDTRKLQSNSTVANSYGNSRIRLNADDELRVNAFGESKISYTGPAQLDKGIVIGESDITRAD